MDYDKLKEQRNHQGGHAQDMNMKILEVGLGTAVGRICLLYTSPSPRD